MHSPLCSLVRLNGTGVALQLQDFLSGVGGSFFLRGIRTRTTPLGKVCESIHSANHGAPPSSDRFPDCSVVIPDSSPCCRSPSGGPPAPAHRLLLTVGTSA
jgi:hypothetical protein